jgi:hypothetical protein
MSTPPDVPGGPPGDACAEFRAAVEERCEAARAASAAYEAINERLRELRRDLVAAQHRLAEAQVAADPASRSAEKDEARKAYERAQELAESDEQLAAATAEWAGAIDRVNRTAKLTKRAVSEAGTALAAVETALQEAEREEQTSRIHAEQAEAGCLDARVRLAACEEGSAAPETEVAASPSDPHAATGGHAVALSETGVGVPLVIESMVSGDRLALELAAERIAAQTGLALAEAQLQLQELIGAVMSAAAEEGFLVFDTRYPFWSGLSFEEAHDVVGALARLGFVFEPGEGWHAGRSPTPQDLSMALGYAGLDTRNVRDLPDADELRLLPRSIGVDARAFLAAQAPDLSIEKMVRILDRRATQLEPLWNEWGQVRPILLSDRHALGSVPG